MMLALRGHTVCRALGARRVEQAALSSSSKNKQVFRPRRRPDRKYRPTKGGVKKIPKVSPQNPHMFVDLSEGKNVGGHLGDLYEDFIQQYKRDRLRKLENPMRHYDQQEEDLRAIDTYMARDGSIEDEVGFRRGFANEFASEEDKQAYLKEIEEILKERRLVEMGLDPESQKTNYIDDIEREDTDGFYQDNDPETNFDPNAFAHGEWSEMMVTVDRTSKLWRGGRLYSYRALVVGGNGNGCGGFGLGKSSDPIEAVAKASRKCKRNIFFLDRFHGKALTCDLVGKCNSVKMVIRATNNGLRGNPLALEILKRFGVVNASCKAIGRNRSPLNMVTATFRALMTHEGPEEIAMKRGRRMTSIDRSIRLGTAGFVGLLFPGGKKKGQR